MAVSEFIQLNRRRIEAYRRVMRGVGVVLLAAAAYVAVGGILRILLFSGAEPSPIGVNSFGFADTGRTLLSQVAQFALPGLLAMGIGDYLAYVLGTQPRPRLGFRFLPGVLAAGAAWAAVNALWSLAGVALHHHTQSLGTAPLLSPVLTIAVWSTLPAVTRAVAQLGLALVVIKLNDVIAESKATV
jgi:hypothetical protein